MSDFTEEELLNASLELLESRKLRNRLAFCMCCGDQMYKAPIQVCSECLYDECDSFMKNATD